MVITFNELRRIKDKLPSGSSQRIADELNIDVNVVRNYFGGTHFKEGGPVGMHLEKGPDGGVVTLDDAAILECAMRIIAELEAQPAE
ncbi:MAG: DNA-binding protein [Alistipes sp.]|nr:DNA-binding protein [Alistipes sp.]